MSTAVVRSRVQKRLAPGASLSDVQVIVHIADPPRLEVLRGGQRIAERRFEDFPTGCNARRDAIAIAVALALERARAEVAPTTGAETPSGSASTATTRRTQPAAAAVAPSPAAGTEPVEQSERETAAAQPAADVSTPVETGDDTGPSVAIGAHAGAAAVLEILPATSWAAVLGANVTLDGVTLSASALASLAQRDDVLGGAIESRLLLGRVLACMDLTRFANVALEGCGGALAGAVLASGQGYDSDRSTQLAYAAVLARAALRFPARSWLSARLALDGLAPIVRPAYALRESAARTTEVTPAPFGATLGLEIVLALP